jgi:hypothetical protein
MGKWFAPNAVRRSHDLGGIKRPLIRLLRLLNKHNRDHLQIQKHSEMSRFAICNEACPKRRRAACIKAFNQTFGDDNFDSEEEHEQQEGDNVDCNPTLEARCSTSETHLLIQRDLNDLVRNCKSKAIPVMAWTSPEVSRRLRLPDFNTIAT